MDPSPLKMKRVVPGSGSGDNPMSLDDDVVQIPPPPSSDTSTQKLKQKQMTDMELPGTVNLSKGVAPISHNISAAGTSDNNLSYLEDYLEALMNIEDQFQLSNFLDGGQLERGIAAEISGPADLVSSQDLILKKLESFKQFDIVQDHSDHHYSSTEQSPISNEWTESIQNDWWMLETALPDTIFVTMYERRTDLLRAVIIGAQATPYHDGIFFFDVQLPPSYPSTPPNVFYHSGGLPINPLLYQTGDVRLSLLNKWVPGSSTVLQVLVSLQGLVLNAEPFYSEPAHLAFQGSSVGEEQSMTYNENAFLLSLKNMLYTMRRPPKNFEDFVFGHFYKRAHEILIACKSYLDGAQVGTLVKGDVEVGDKSCSIVFKMYLAGYVNTLVQAFTKIGVKDCEKYTVPDLLYEFECLIMQPPPHGC